ncbi:cytochrome P450 [Microdochium trichocladiopsis]|uniref:Cytochrome P450 n=1 Tax=Microdochium trichocladiopsis TaxID=1682393 RepID=A0A9P8YG47_9PEZI|nr:cytochrome P450 [Microdochium trichocladiopsis]KAH7038346.1 cytochrome P450 [Microdochium trichocladiopsis]
MPNIIRTTLTPAIGRLNHAMMAEVDAAVLRELGECIEWTPIEIYGKIMRILAVASGRVFIGPELCHDERYIEAVVNYTIVLNQATLDIKKLNPWLKRFQAHRLHSVIALKKLEDRFLTFIAPTVEARRKAMTSGQTVPDDMLTWLMTKGAGDGIETVRDIGLNQLGLTHVASFATGATATNVLYDLAFRQQYIKPLRDEVRETLAGFDGKLTTPALRNLQKMDSVMKESLRMHPLVFSTFERRALQSFTLSDGHFIPKGTNLEIPNHAIARDPEIFPDPDAFKPWRFYEMGEKNTEKNGGGTSHQFVSVSTELGSFGYGRDACPGRFYAADELKMILARILMAYDVRMVDGETERYPNLDFGGVCIPDPTRKLLFKRVVDSPTR